MEIENTLSAAYVGKMTGELRIMFYNIYGYKWYPDKVNQPHLSSGPVPLRQEMEIGLIKKYAPDVLGMQEYCTAYNQGMTPMLEQAGYRRVDVWHAEPDAKGEKINFTPLFYRPEHLRELDRGYVLYEGPNDVNSKSLTWAVFEDLRTSKSFVAICTHFMYNDRKLPEGVPNATRVGNAKQLLQTVDEIGQKYKGLPVIMGGDLNCLWGSDPYRTLCEGGMQWLYEIAEVKDESRGLKTYATYDANTEEYITCPQPENDPKRAIDYMWLKQGETYRAKISAYITVTDREACLSSDHCPRFADVTLQG